MNELNNIKNPNELLKYMTSNITYGFVGKNGKKYLNQYSDEWNDWYQECVVQTGEEVLETKVGTCWDQVELERLWFTNNNYKFNTYFIWFEVNHKNDYSTHTFLIYENDNKYYWFENAFEEYRGIHEFDSEDNAIDYVMNKLCEFVEFNSANFSDEDKKLLAQIIEEENE